MGIFISEFSSIRQQAVGASSLSSGFIAQWQKTDQSPTRESEAHRQGEGREAERVEEIYCRWNCMQPKQKVFLADRGSSSI